MLQAKAFYLYEDVPDSDEEISIGHGSPSDISAASSQAGSAASQASSVDIQSAEVLSRSSPQHAAEESPPSRDTAAVAISNQAGSSDRTAANGQSASGQITGDGTAAAAASHEDSTHTQSMQNHSSTHVPETVHAPKAESSPGMPGRSDNSRQEASAVEPEHATTSAVNGSQTEAVSQTCSEAANDSHQDGVAKLADNPSAIAHASPYHDLQTAGLSEATRKRKAATVFDQGVAEEAEAADLDDGIVAIAADDTYATAGQQANHSSIVGKAAEHLPGSTAQTSVPTKQSRKSQPKSAPWR